MLDRSFAGGGVTCTYVRIYCSMSEMRYCEVSEEMSSLYFGLAVFCLFEGRVPELTHNSCPPTKEALYTRRETAVCICPSSGGGSFEYIT